MTGNRFRACVIALFATLVSIGCATRRLDVIWDEPSASVDAGPDAPVASDPRPPSFGAADAATPVADDKKFFLVVTESPVSPDPNGSNWGGILRQEIAKSNAAATPGQGIPKSVFRDPLGLAFRNKSAEMFVSNRQGNSGMTNILRFRYDAKTESFTPAGAPITAPGIVGIHQITFNPAEDELFAATMDQGLFRFKLDASGNWQPNGTLADHSWIRGLVVSPSGKRLYATGASNVVRQWDLSQPGSPELTQLTVPSSTASGPVYMHYMWRADNDVYVGAFNANVIMHFTIDPADDITLSDMIPASNSPSGIALSPDGREMFALGTVNSSVIQRFSLVNGSWTPTTTINMGSNLGCALVFPASAKPQVN